MKDIQGSVFSDFEVPNTSDGSYRGRKHIVDKTKEHYDMKFKEELLKVNTRLKSSKTKVTLSALNGGIQLRATLPLKPDDARSQGKEKKQYNISLGIPANFDGLKTAEEEAQELGKLIARQTFTWTDKYLGVQATKNKSITFAEFYDVFEKKYFETRKKNIKSENSFKSWKSLYKTYFLSNDLINEQNFRNKILSLKTDHSRNSAIMLTKVIAKLLELEIKVNDLKVRYKPKSREIPLDKDIEKLINNFEFRFNTVKCTIESSKVSWKLNKLIYGLLATYGLRPREIVNKPDLDWFVSPENKKNTFKVHESNKTGYREVFPFVSEWIELFDLKNSEALELLRQKSNSWINADQLKSRVHVIANSFRVNDIPFAPYDLRHACAIRAHLQGIPIKAASDNLGHTVEIHTKVYQSHFGLENRRKAFDNAFESINEVDALKDALTKANKRIAELELEITRLRLETMK